MALRGRIRLLYDSLNLQFEFELKEIEQEKVAVFANR